MPYWVGRIHLWLGLTSGLVVFIIAITGCLYAFKTEIEELTQGYRFVEPQNSPVLPPSKLAGVAQAELPGKKIHAVLYTGADRAAQVIFFNFEPDYYYYYVFVDPYSAEVLKVTDMERDFFQIVLDGHFYLWLPPTIGQPVSATATLIFVVMLITGIVLWWPRKKNAVKQRFTIRWNARWRRKNYDLHNVMGFYVSWLAIVLALTGLVWGFQWFANGVYGLAGGEKSLVYIDAESDTTAIRSRATPAIDRVWLRMLEEYPKAQAIEVHLPEFSTSSIAANANPDRTTYWQTDYRYFDQYTLEELSVDHIYGRMQEADAADTLMRMNYDIHIGAIMGLPGKVLAFCVSLLVASLPVTGFIIWWGRKNKETKVPRLKHNRKAALAEA